MKLDHFQKVWVVGYNDWDEAWQNAAFFTTREGAEKYITDATDGEDDHEYRIDWHYLDRGYKD